LRKVSTGWDKLLSTRPRREWLPGGAIARKPVVLSFCRSASVVTLATDLWQLWVYGRPLLTLTNDARDAHPQALD
jgi:hypothetical protein